MKPILSVLILSNDGREAYLESLKYNIARQMLKGNLKEGVDIEVIISKDMKGQYTNGVKMNALLQSCKGDWAFIISDDCQLAQDYLVNAINIIKTKNPDCINATVFKTVNGLNPITIHYDMQKKQGNPEQGASYQSLCYLNIIRTSISKKFNFPEIGVISEIGGWSEQISKSGEIKTEGRIENITCYQQLITI